MRNILIKSDALPLFGNDAEIGTMLCNYIDEKNNGHCCDTITINRDICIIRLRKYSITGNEDWYYDDQRKSYYFHCNNKYYENTQNAGIKDPMICSHFKWISENRALKYGEFSGGETNEVYFNYDYGKGGIDAFKNWLKKQAEKTPVEFVYILKKPIVTKLSSHGIASYYPIESEIQIQIQSSSPNKY